MERLKTGLAVLRAQIKERKDSLLRRLDAKETISVGDADWLDQDANLIDEERVIEALENASDYERGLGRLTLKQKGVVAKLKELGGAVKDSIGNQRKRPAEPRKVPEKKTKDLTPQFTHKERATYKQKVEILDWHHKQGPKQSQGRTAAHWDKIYPNLVLKQPIISDWVKNEAVIRKRYGEELARGNGGTAKRVRQVEHPEVNEMLELWVQKAMGDGIIVSGEILRQKWHRFADMKEIPKDDRLVLSEGWLAAFKKRCGLRNYKSHGEAGSASAANVEKERERLRKLIRKHGFQLKDIFNMDETGLFWAMPPDRGLMDKPSSGVKGDKKRLTYAFTINATGSEKLPPIIIGKAKQPRAFNKKTGAQLGFYYRNNAKAWMTTILYHEWIRDWDAQLRLKNRKILLLQDNFSAHVPPDDITNIIVENFEPNLTAHVQPADAGIIKCFKAHYRAHFMNRAIDRYDSGISPGNIYDINILESMRLAELAWNEVDSTTIRNCWRKSGILPDSLFDSATTTTPVISVLSLLNNDPVDGAIAAAEKEVTHTLSHLEERGVLQPRNRLTLEELLNPVTERVMLSGGTGDDEIYQAVMERVEGEQNQEINGGDDGDRVDDSAEPERPTRREALKAASLLQDYVLEMEDSFARDLQVILARFGRQTRLAEVQSLRPSVITDFFTSVNANA